MLKYSPPTVANFSGRLVAQKMFYLIGTFNRKLSFHFFLYLELSRKSTELAERTDQASETYLSRRRNRLAHVMASPINKVRLCT